VIETTVSPEISVINSRKEADLNDPQASAPTTFFPSEMSFFDDETLPEDVTSAYSLLYEAYLTTEYDGTRVFRGTLILGETNHSVTIERSRGVFGLQPLSHDLHQLVSRDPNFSAPFFEAEEEGELVTVSPRYECGLYESVDLPDGLSRLPPWVAVRECISLVKSLHHGGFFHCNLSAQNFVIVDSGRRLGVQLRGFRTAQAAPSDDDAALDLQYTDYVHLRVILLEFISIVRAYEPSIDAERHLLFADLFEEMRDSNRERNTDLSTLLSHPALQPYDQTLAFAVAVSDFFDTTVDETGFGYQLLLSVDAASGSDFRRWQRHFPDGIDDDNRSEARKPFVYNLLDNPWSLQYATRTFRNRVAHRAANLTAVLGEAPYDFTQSWVKRLPEMWIRLWRVVVRQKFQERFPGYFRRHE
jgi:hypothetical protein